MEVESHDEADPEPACGAIESVFIKEEVMEDEGTDVETVSSSDTSTHSNTVPRTIESVYIKEESVQFESEEEVTSSSLSSETAVSDSDVCLSDDGVCGSKCIEGRDHEADAHPTHIENTVRVKRPRKRKIYHKKETEEERALRLSKQRSYYFKRRVNETSADREERLKKIRENAKKRRLKETDEERAVRLREKRMYETQRLGSESADKRALRLEKQRLYQAQRVKHETPEERAQRLKNKRSSYQRRRLNKKSSDMDSGEAVDQNKCGKDSHRSVKRNEILRDLNPV